MQREVRVAPRRVIDVCDWRQDVGDGRIRFTPTSETFTRTLAAPVLGAMIIAFMWIAWGLPPGSAKLARERHDIAELAQRIERQEQQARRFAISDGPTTQRMAEQAADSVAEWRRVLARRERDLANAKPTLGPTYDAIYWGVFGVCVLGGLGLPLTCVIARTELRVDGDHLAVRQWPGRTRRYPIRSFVGVKPLAQRRSSPGTADTVAYDHGWLWDLAVIADADRPLPPGSPPARTLVFRVELNKTLPAGRSMLPAGAANIARLLQDHAGLHCSGATTGEFAYRPTGFLGAAQRVFRRRDAPAPDLSRLPPLD
ncbi:MAG: hypothetical protein AAF842_02435 [Planctomycetota bacterium]